MLNINLSMKNKKIILLSVLFVTVSVLVTCFHSKDKVSIEVGEYDNTYEVNEIDMMVANNSDGVEINYKNPSDSTQEVARRSILVEDTGREDPFLPENEIYDIQSEAVNALHNKPKPSYELLPPPETITSDKMATDVMTTRVSGLLYDKISPSAIINIDNKDFLVKKGDVINDYKVLDIEKNFVTVQHGVNVYKAGVGELLTGKDVNYNTISNLDQKFGGVKNSVNKNK